ncbi:hypothetical protein DUNSADRAFT_5763 [Dunaliella salina]|uniref:Calcineurin-like phosphoesterase domain-containing protein n=1 Tax=Dunaliella salina TaxID=3046 RepID=A0ABQ7H758_DUNSA|nr:hypothetical protein DUNSADRAFT_5763 [Dunaliella salina]|eukprot:KAF5842687.1 hypothetical protein DUNSADRAFT_5763 [Dunaliella salina]
MQYCISLSSHTHCQSLKWPTRRGDKTTASRVQRSNPKNVACHANQKESDFKEQLHHLHVYAISDVHCDHELNAQWVKNLPPCGDAPNTKRVLLVAGDVSSDLEKLRRTLIDLKQRFDVLLYVPGNHCLWLTSSKDPSAHADSVAKLRAVIEVCAQLPGVYCTPIRLGQLVLAPTYSWHHQSWDQEPDIPGNLVPRASKLTIGDYVKCAWPPEISGPGLGDVALAEWMDSLNDACGWDEVERLCGKGSAHQIDLKAGISKAGAALESDGSGSCEVITFSHFLPFQDLLPEKRFLTFPNLAKAVGSQPLGERISQLRPLLHVFGHSHFAWDAHSAAGVRCLQAPLCYPKERQERMRSLRMTSSCAQGPAGPALHADCPWLPLLICTAQYSLQPRQPPQCEQQRAQELEGLLDSGALCLMAACDSLQTPKNVSEHRQIRGYAEAAALLGNSSSSSSSSSSSRRGRSLPCLLTHLHQQAGGVPVEVASWSLDACPSYHAMWSHYYQTHEREPSNTELAPWVAAHYIKRRTRLWLKGLL